MRYEKSDEPIVAMIIEPMIYRTSIARWRGDGTRRKLNLAKGFWVGKVKENGHDNINWEEKCQKGKPPKIVSEDAIWRNLNLME